MRKLSMEELNRPSVEEFKELRKIPLVIVLDNIRSLNNVGSAFRTSDAFLVERICLCGITGTPPHREIQKTALGATESINWTYFAETDLAIQQLKEAGFTICAFEQTQHSIMLDQFMPAADAKYALVFGNEVFGVEDKVLAASDHIIEIPQFGTKHSFNIAVTIGIAVWDFVNKLKLFNS